MQLSQHLSQESFQHSDKANELGINNTLPASLLPHAETYAKNCYEIILEVLGETPLLNSGYRCPALNAALPGSSKTSQHMTANAMDLHPQKRSLTESFKTLIQSNLVFDQIFIEGVKADNPAKGWIHCSYNTHPDFNNGQNRMQIKIVNFINGEPHYIPVTRDQAVAWCEKRS
jgi:hypothetical protein